MNLLQQAFFFLASANLTIGVYIYLRRRDRIGKSFLAFMLLCALWAYGIACFITDAPISYTERIAVLRLSQFAAIFIPLGWVTFLQIFLGAHQIAHDFKNTISGVALCLATVSFTPLFVNGITSRFDYPYHLSSGPLYHLFALYFAITMGVTFYKLYRVCCLEADRDRKWEYRLLIMSTVILFCSGGSSFGPIYGVATPKWVMGLVIFYPFVLGYAISSKGLLNAELLAAERQRMRLMQLGMISSCIHHEIKNPLYLVQNSLVGLRENMEVFAGQAERARAPLMREIKEGLERNLNLLDKVQQILKTFSDFLNPRVGPRGKGNQNGRVSDINAVLADVLKNICDLEMSKNVRIDHKMGSRPLCCRVNATILEEICFNLLSNACFAMSDGGYVECSAVRKNGKVELSISDDGPGMSEGQLAHLFQPLHSSRLEKGGTGLGLFITKQLVENQGGRISVKSRPGRGTTFTVSFEVAK